MHDANNSESNPPQQPPLIHPIASTLPPTDIINSRHNSVEYLTDRDVHTSVPNVDDGDIRPPPSKRLKSSPSATGSGPASAAGPAPIKPKSKAPRPRSPSPTPPPPPPPPLQTVRLEIKLGGPDNYEVNISSLAKSTGQRQPTPPPPKPDTSESEGEDDHNAQDNDKRKKKKVILTFPVFDHH